MSGEPFELIDGVVFESMGLFATYREALEWARSCRLEEWEIWRGNELIEAVSFDDEQLRYETENGKRLTRRTA